MLLNRVMLVAKKNLNMFLDIFFCIRKTNAFLLFTILFSLSFVRARADGSRNLYPSGCSGKRAYLQSETAIANYDLFPTKGTMKVYVNAGEKLYIGSSALGLGSGAINIRKPSGTSISVTTTTNGGVINNRTEELAGPYYNSTVRSTGYHPYTVIVDETGIWEVDFVSPGTSTTQVTGTTDIDANFAWTQTSNQPNNIAFIAAFDISVGSSSDASTLISGRVYCNNFNANIVQSSSSAYSFYSNFYVLTNVGYTYKVQSNGFNGASFNFFSNNKGVQKNTTGIANPNATTPLTWMNGDPSYLSTSYTYATGNQTYIYDPRQPDNGTKDVTHKIFFTVPSSDLPDSADISYNGAAKTRTWLKIAASGLPVISNLNVVGAEGGATGIIGPDGANISFTSNISGKYSIGLSFGAGFTNRTLTGDCINGSNLVAWDGYDGTSPTPIKVTNGVTISVTGKLTAGEVHFPLNDVEINPNGIIIELLQSDNSSLYSPTKDTVYWNDNGLPASGNYPSSPITNLNGLHSNSNGHKWGTYSSSPTNQFGNNVVIDTWGYVTGESQSATVTATVKQLDLAVDVINVSTATPVCAGTPVTYTAVVENINSSASYVDAIGAVFGFKVPVGFVITGHTFTPNTQTSDSAVSSNESVTDSSFTATLNIKKGAKATYTITGYTNTAGTPSVEAYVIRPPDVTDIDATSSVVGTPTDPQVECDGGTVGCNNIKWNTALTVNALPTLGGVNQVSAVCSGTNATINLSGLLASTTQTVSYNINGSSTQTASVTSNASGAGSFTVGVTSVNNGQVLTVTGIQVSGGTACSQTFSSSNTVTLAVNALPAAPTASGSQSFCGSGTITGLSATAPGGSTVNWYSNSPGGTALSGSTALVNGTTYYAESQNTTTLCVSSSRTAVTVTINPLPTAYAVSGGGSYCSGGTGVAVALSNSQSGVNYQLQIGGTNTGSVVAGTGSGISFGNQTSAGYYTVVATDATTGCTASMTGNVAVSINPLPTKYTVTGGGSYCSGGTGVAVALSNSQSGVNYQLQIGGTNTGSVVAGTGSFISFGNQTSAGNYTVVATDATTGCTASMTGSVAVIVNPIPTATTATVTSGGATTFCSGGSVSLTLSASGGTGFTYQWYMNSSPIGGATSSTYDATQTGTYTVIVTNSSGCSGTSTGTTVTVNPLPTASILNGATVGVSCGGNALLTASTNAVSPTTYQWNLNGVVIGSATSSTYSAASAGSYTVAVTDGNGCSQTSAATQVLSASASANGPQAVCQGGTVELTATSGYTTPSYQWNLNGSPISGAINSSYTATVSGNYTCTISDGTNSSTTCPITITVNANPTPSINIAGGTSVCVGNTIQLSANTAYSVYKWLLGGNAISGASSNTYTVSQSGLYSLQVTDANGCIGTSSSTTLTIEPLPATPVPTSYTLSNICPTLTADLTSIQPVAASGTTLEWHTGNTSSSSIVSTPSSVIAGTYYLFAKGSAPNSCYSLSSSGVTVTIVSCVIPVTENGTAPATGGTAISSIVGNDLVNGSPVTLGSGGNATISQSGASWQSGITLNTNTGAITVDVGTIPGIYPVTYQLCDVLSSITCNSITDTITVTPVVNPVTESGIAPSTGGIAIANVLSNDSTNGQKSDLTNSVLSQSGTWPSGITLDINTGAIKVASGTKPGVYPVVYQLCDTLTPANCATVTDTVKVTAVINPVGENGAVPATGGVAIGNVMSNDSTNGRKSDLTNSVLSQSGTWQSGITLDINTGAIKVASGTKPGVYPVVYQLCDTLTPANCATVTDTVKVTAVINPVTENGTVASTTGGVAINNVLSNDSTNGLKSDLTNSVISQYGTWQSGITLDINTGAINVAVGTIPGIYPLIYQVCDKLSPQTCATVTDYITVTAGPIPSSENGTIPSTGGTVISNVAANDVVNGLPVILGSSGNAVISQSGIWTSGITLNPLTGAVNVLSGATPGVYPIVYQLCDKLTPQTCKTVTDTVKITPVINPATETGTISAAGGIVIGNVLNNDSTNGQKSSLINSVISQSGTWAPGITLNTTTGAVSVAAGTIPGVYPVTYQLCDKLTPQNCAIVKDTVIVLPFIQGLGENGSAFATGGTAIMNVANNDKVNGILVTLGAAGNATISQSGVWTAGITLDPMTGNINVASGTIPGTYNLAYQLCDKLTPQTCTIVNITVTVVPPPINVRLVKTATAPQMQPDGTFIINYTITATNLSSIPLDSIQISDNLRQVLPSTATYNVISVAASGQLTKNNLYDGNLQTGLLDAKNSRMAIGKTDSINLMVQIDMHGQPGTITNVASLAGRAFYMSTITGYPVYTAVSDGSAVPIDIPNVDLYIPDAFTPNHDGINDAFVIRHPSNVSIDLEVYNRWGNVVYKNANYNNDWMGTGIGNFLGKDLEDGTYYYIVKVKDKSTGNITANRVGYLTIRR